MLASAMVTEGTEVLDVGSGPGDLAADAAELGADTVGIDVALGEQTLDAQAAIRSWFDELVGVHRRADGTLAIPVAVQVTRGRRP